MWEEVAKKIRQKGGIILTETEVVALDLDEKRIVGVLAKDLKSGQVKRFSGEYFVSTLPIKELVRSMKTDIPVPIKQISDGLLYRDFITVGLLLDRLKLKDAGPQGGKTITDNWIYIQEPGVLAGRLQIFNNWSPYLVDNPSKIWIGVEYFCCEHDSLWSLNDEAMAALAIKELDKIGIIDDLDVRDSFVFHMAKTYPAYFGTYSQFDQLREYLDGYENLFLVGRNGMHKYNNQDHSMLTAMLAVENMARGISDKSNIWAVNTEMVYHEESEKTVKPEEPATMSA